jgi:hypothetical protein
MADGDRIVVYVFHQAAKWDPRVCLTVDEQGRPMTR